MAVGTTGYPSIDKPWLKYYKKEPKSVSMPNWSIYEDIWQKNKDYLDDIALEFYDKEITYGKLFENIDLVTKALQYKGISKLDIVTVCLPNIPETIYIFYALVRIGAACHFLEPGASDAVMREHLKLTESKLLFTIPECYELFKNMDVVCERHIDIVVVDVLQTLNCGVNYNFDGIYTEWEEFVKNRNNTILECKPYDDNLPVCILHTGGTTGIPKGVLLTNNNFHSLVIQWEYLDINYIRGNILLSLMPPFASFGLTANLHVPLTLGMKLILIPEYNPSKIVDQIKKYRPNCIPASPAHWEMVYHNMEIKDMDLSFLKTAFVGGDTLNLTVEKGINDILTKNNVRKIIKGYGMTETTTGLTMTSFPSVNYETSVGIPLFNTTIGIFDENNKELTYNKIGEICVQSDNVMLGYYKMKSETDNVIKIHENGGKWFHTGDLGLINEDGILYIKGRLKRIIIRYDGIKIYPIEIENKLLECQLVSSCAVIGVQDPEHLQGKIPIAYIVLKDKNHNLEYCIKTFEKFCNENIIYYAIPKSFRIIDKLPYTQKGKVDFCKLEGFKGNTFD